MATPVEVDIMGQKFSVTSEDGVEHLREVAGFVDSKMKEIGGSEKKVSPYARAVLAALNIASECQKLRAAQDEVERVIGRLTNLLDEEGGVPNREENLERA